jgi:hypothetical protein
VSGLRPPVRSLQVQHEGRDLLDGPAGRGGREELVGLPVRSAKAQVLGVTSQFGGSAAQGVGVAGRQAHALLRGRKGQPLSLPVSYERDGAAAVADPLLRNGMALRPQLAQHGPVDGLHVQEFRAVGNPLGQNPEQFTRESGEALARGCQRRSVLRGGGHDVGAVDRGLIRHLHRWAHVALQCPPAEAAVHDDHLVACPAARVQHHVPQLGELQGAVEPVAVGVRQCEAELGVGGEQAVPGEVQQEGVARLGCGVVYRLQNLSAGGGVEQGGAVLLGQAPKIIAGEEGTHVGHVVGDGRQSVEFRVVRDTDDDGPRGRSIGQGHY